MKKFLFPCLIFAIFFFTRTSAQQLSIEQAVLQTGFFPVPPACVWGGPAGGYLVVRDSSLVSVQARNGKETTILTVGELNRVLSPAGISSLQRVPVPQILPSGNFRFILPSAVVDFDWITKKITGKISIPEGSANLEVAGPVTLAAFTEGQNVVIMNDAGKKIPVTDDREKGIINGQSVSRNEFGISKGLFWSPKGTLLAFYRKDESKVTEYPLVNIMTTPASAEFIRYPMAGGASERISVGIFNPVSGTKVYLDEKAFGDDRYLTNISWDPSENFLYVAVLNREQNHLLLNQYDVKTGLKIRTLFEEKSEKYVEPLNELKFNPVDPSQFIWISERDGYEHLYLYRTDGTFVRQLTSGAWAVTDFTGWDKKGKYIYFTATDPSPLERHAYRLDVRSGARTRLTPDPGTHDVYVSQDGSFLIDSYSNYKVPRNVVLRETGAKESKIIFQAPDPLINLTLGEYRSFTIKAADKRTDLSGYLVLPPHMDPDRKYPVIIYVYGGPHAQLAVNKWMGGASGWQHYMAQQGFISMTLDNRGSDARGRDFEQVIHRNLGKAEMADQMEGISYLFSLPFVDSNRIGVHGWSYGGFMTTSLMLNYPDIFKVGVAGGPVTDWKFYEVMYGERYMDMPSENPEGYELSSTLPKIKNLRGRLMLIHGDNDPTVVWQNSLVFVRKCIDEGKLVDYMVYPGHPHNVRGKDRVHLMRTVSRYFLDNL